MPDLQAGTVTRVVTPEIQKRLYDETDARFAVQTGITRKLDPNNKIDQKFVPAWQKLYGDVLRQFQGGTLAWTYDHPGVAQAIANASAAAGQLATHLTDLATAPTNEAKAAAATNAAAAHATADAATGKAAAAQAMIEAGKRGAEVGEAAHWGGRGGMAEPSPAVAVVDPSLIRRAANEIAAEVARGVRMIEHAGDAATAIQAAGAPARADAVTTIATGGTPPSPAPAPSPSPDGGRHGTFPVVPVAVVGVLGLGAIALATQRPSARARRGRSAQTLKIRVAR